MARTLVAVGTSRLVTMLVAMAFAGPRRIETTSSSGAVGALTFLGSCAGMGCEPVPDSVFLEPSRATVAGAFLTGAGAGAAAGAAEAGGADGGAGVAAGAAGAAFTTGISRVAGWAAACPEFPLEEELPAAPKDSNSGHHLASTAFLSFWYCSYSSSTSHSFPPNSSGRRWLGCSGT
jgi:hypothetical protein